MNFGIYTIFIFFIIFFNFSVYCIEDYNDTDTIRQIPFVNFINFILQKVNKTENPQEIDEDKKYETMRTILTVFIYFILQSLPEPEPELKHLNGKTKEEIKEILQRVWDRRQIELKEAMESMTTETKEMQKRIDIIVNETSTEEDIITAINDLEYYISDQDNAHDLDNLGGLSLLVHLLTDESINIKKAALTALGTCVKNIKEIQDMALNYHPIPIIFNILNDSYIQSDYLTSKKSMYCLGSLLRNNPSAQQEFLNIDGFSYFHSILNDKSTTELKLKIYALISDLLDESLTQCILIII